MQAKIWTTDTQIYSEKYTWGIKMSSNSSFKVKIQKMGAFLSAEVMPNIGVFIGWGVLAALFIPTGWLPNETLNQLVAPTMKYLMPLLIAYTGGSNVHGRRGGVIGAFATMGVILGADINMLAGAMFMGPFAAWCIKKVDKMLEGKVKPGMEMLVNNFSLGLVGALLMVAGFFAFVPVIQGLIGVFSVAINALIDKGLLPLMAFFVQPGKILFLNNAINHGIMIPLGVEQATQTGKSLLFMLEANNGCVLGVALAFALFGKGTAKKAAPGAAFINFFGGIGEVVYPFVLSKPITLLGQIAGSFVSILIIQNFGGGTVAAISPGSFFALVAVSAKGSLVVNIISYFAGMITSCLVAGFFLKMDKSEEGEDGLVLETALKDVDVNTSVPAVDANAGVIKRIVFACDAGMGSSVMGESIMKTKINKAMLDMEVMHTSVRDIDKNIQAGDAIVTTKALEDRVRSVLQSNGMDNQVFPVENLLDGAAYDKLIQNLKS